MFGYVNFCDVPLSSYKYFATCDSGFLLCQINIHFKNFNFQITYYMFLVFFIRMWYFFVFMVKFLKKSCRAIFLFTSLETISCGLKTSLKIVLFGKNTSRGKVFACKVPLHDQSHFLNYSSIIDNWCTFKFLRFP